jgi:hypothetical protein
MDPAEEKFPVPEIFPLPGLAKEHLQRALRNGNIFSSRIGPKPG